MARTNKLNDTQLVILSAAAAREDHMALPLPASLRSDDPEADKAIASLTRRKLLEEVDIPVDAPAWRTDGDLRLGLKATDKALEAIGVIGDTDTQTPAPTDTLEAAQPAKPSSRSQRASAPTGRSGTKAETVLSLLVRKKGASIKDMMEPTGWQAHSVRGFLSGTIKKRMGLEVTSERAKNGERRYRIVSA